MNMSNVHERTIAAPAARVGTLLDTLASPDDKFWPHENWPGVKFNLPLQVGATGGHGTGPYTVSSYTPATRVFSTTLPVAVLLAILPANFAAQEHDGRQLSAHWRPWE
jgi:hypothetical protein